MTRKIGNKHKAIWFFFTTLLSIFNICTIRIFVTNWPLTIVSANAVLSLAGLVFYMHVDEITQKRRLIKAAGFLLLLNSISVFLMLGLSMFILTSQYHNPQTADRLVSTADEVRKAMEETDGGVTLLETEELYIYYADYDNISFVAGERPSKNNDRILLCVAAAFQSAYRLDFQQSNIVGVHASNGELYSGTPQDGLGAFTYVDGTARIWDVGEAEEAVREAAANGGSGYQQFVALYDGKRGSHDSDEFRCYRVLALLDGRACIIDSKTQMHYGEFIGALEKLGVKDALYCDMGSGWNFSWYWNEEGKTVDIIGTPWPFSHNWLTFEG